MEAMDLYEILSEDRSWKREQQQFWRDKLKKNQNRSRFTQGRRLVPLAKVEEHLLSSTEVGNLLGISANMVGRLANANGIKTAECGEMRLDKAKHSGKQVESFFYNQTGVDRLRQLTGERAA